MNLILHIFINMSSSDFHFHYIKEDRVMHILLQIIYQYIDVCAIDMKKIW